MKLFCKIFIPLLFTFGWTVPVFSDESYTDTDGQEVITVIGDRQLTAGDEVLPTTIDAAINNCKSDNSTSSYCVCLKQKELDWVAGTPYTGDWLNECSVERSVANTDEEAGEQKTAVATQETQTSRRNTASTIKVGNLDCNNSTLNRSCSRLLSQDNPTVITDNQAATEGINSARGDQAAITNDIGSDPYDNAQFDCQDSLEHDKSGAEYVCNNPVKALGGPAAQAVRAIGQYGNIGAGVVAATGKESLNKLCTTIAMLSATGVGIGVAARKKCNGKINKCKTTCEQEKTQICGYYQTAKAQCSAFKTAAAAGNTIAINNMKEFQKRIATYQEEVEKIDDIKSQCKKLEANIAGMGQDILNIIMTLGSAQACRDATGGKYTADIDSCEERGGQVIPDPLGNMICKEPEQRCTTTSQCPTNKMCIDGICRTITGICPDGSLKACTDTCENDEPPANCPRTCADGSANYPNCGCDNCPNGETCNSQQKCVKNNNNKTCADGSANYPNCGCDNCPNGETCNSQQKCVENNNNNTCPDTSLTYPNCDCNCPTGQICNSQRKCVEDNGTGTCADGSRIACGQTCPNGSQPTGCRSCNSNSECGENQICNRGVCVSEDPVLEMDGSGGGGAATDGGLIEEDPLAITNDGMGGGDGDPNPTKIPGMELPGATQMGDSQGAGAGYGGGSSASGGSGGGGGFFGRLFGGRKSKPKGKGRNDESGATVKGAGGGGFGGYGGGGRKRNKLALNKKQIKKRKKEKGAKRTLAPMKNGLGGVHHNIFERITTRFTHLCKNKLSCR